MTVGPFLIAAGLLILSGSFKVVAPGGVVAAVGTLGRRVSPLVGRFLGIAEIAIGAWGVVGTGRIPAALVGLAYLSFGGVVALLRRRGGESCGCFGGMESPPSHVHLAFDIGAAVVAFWHGLGGGTPELGEVGAGSPGGPILFALVVALGVAAATAVLTVLPGVLAGATASREDARARHDRRHDHDITIELSPRT